MLGNAPTRAEGRKFVVAPRCDPAPTAPRSSDGSSGDVTRTQNDKYEPLPGLLSLPGFLYRKLGARGRLAVKVGVGVLLVGVTVASVVLLPRIAESNRERAAKERRDAAAALAERRRKLIAEQRPQRGRADPSLSPAALVQQVEEQVLADARARAVAGKLSGPAAKRVECERIGHGQDPKLDRVVYDCVAVTSDLPTIDNSRGGVIGHPFRAVIHFSTGRFAWCKVSGRPNEGDIASRALLAIPRACSL
jgi:hypothetical protein